MSAKTTRPRSSRAMPQGGCASARSPVIAARPRKANRIVRCIVPSINRPSAPRSSVGISRMSADRAVRDLARPAVGTLENVRPLLVLLLTLALDVELLLLAPEIRLSLPLELVPFDRQGVVDGD